MSLTLVCTERRPDYARYEGRGADGSYLGVVVRHGRQWAINEFLPDRKGLEPIPNLRTGRARLEAKAERLGR